MRTFAKLFLERPGLFDWYLFINKYLQTKN